MRNSMFPIAKNNMALNQKELEEFLAANSIFQLKINELEIQLNSVTNFLKQQFGDDFQLNSAYSYNSDSSAKANANPLSSAQHHQQQLIQKQVSNCSHTNEISSSHMIDIATNFTTSQMRNKSVAAAAGLSVFEDVQKINNTHSMEQEGAFNSTVQQEQQYFIIIEKEELYKGTMDEKVLTGLTEEVDATIAVKVELNSLELEQMSPSSTTDSELNDLLADFPTTRDVENSNSCLQRKDRTIDKPFVCDWPKCARRFRDGTRLIIHKIVHTREKPYVCDWQECKKRFARHACLINHRRIHTGEKPYICDWEGCGRQFGLRCSLVKHKRSHTGEKPYICNWTNCGQGFSQSGSLIRHKRTHTGEKPFICDWSDCLQRFSQHGSLIRHRKFHTGEKPFICDDVPRMWKAI